LPGGVAASLLGRSQPPPSAPTSCAQFDTDEVATVGFDIRFGGAGIAPARPAAGMTAPISR
jgi:hypothetical protein